MLTIPLPQPLTEENLETAPGKPQTGKAVEITRVTHYGDENQDFLTQDRKYREDGRICISSWDRESNIQSVGGFAMKIEDDVDWK